MHRKIQLFTCSCYSCIASAACDATDDEKSRLLHAPPGRSVWAVTVHTGVSAVEPARRIGRQCPRAAARGFAIYTRHAIRGNTTIISIDSGLSTLWSEIEREYV